MTRRICRRLLLPVTTPALLSVTTGTASAGFSARATVRPPGGLTC